MSKTLEYVLRIRPVYLKCAWCARLFVLFYIIGWTFPCVLAYFHPHCFRLDILLFPWPLKVLYGVAWPTQLKSLCQSLAFWEPCGCLLLTMGQFMFHPGCSMTGSVLCWTCELQHLKHHILLFICTALSVSPPTHTHTFLLLAESVLQQGLFLFIFLYGQVHLSLDHSTTPLYAANALIYLVCTVRR